MGTKLQTFCYIIHIYDIQNYNFTTIFLIDPNPRPKTAIVMNQSKRMLLDQIKKVNKHKGIPHNTF